MYAAAPKDFYFLIVSSNFQFLALAEDHHAFFLSF